MSEPYSLRALGLSAGQSKSAVVQIDLDPYVQTAIEYVPDPGVEGTIDITAMLEGISLGLKFRAEYHGPCARCLDPAVYRALVTSYELHDSNTRDEEMRSDFVDDLTQSVDVDGWAKEAIGLEFPTRVLCRKDCLGLCPVCGENQNEAGLHEHEQPLDSRWGALAALDLDAAGEPDSGAEPAADPAT
ncbi:MAG: DUF177 domain-containing protein [Thermoleophilia bacterium]|nr:DUF177 domain-containing protein [Thermoleophilia bacterium]